MNLDDFTPANGGSLSRPVISRQQVVGMFSAPAYVHPDELWQPLTRTTNETSDGAQGSPYGSYRPGRAIEKDSQRLVQRFDHVQAARGIRSALRPGI